MWYPDYLQPVLDRIVGDFERGIFCDKGWWPLIADLHAEIVNIDPDYSIYQVKEKFGGLRYYTAPSNPLLSEKIGAVVSKYEAIAAKTCEATGASGTLMRRNGCLKTLNESFVNDNSWQPVNAD